jgi:hypothetical protein
MASFAESLREFYGLSESVQVGNIVTVNETVSGNESVNGVLTAGTIVCTGNDYAQTINLNNDGGITLGGGNNGKILVSSGGVQIGGSGAVGGVAISIASIDQESLTFSSSTGGIRLNGGQIATKGGNIVMNNGATKGGITGCGSIVVDSLTNNSALNLGSSGYVTGNNNGSTNVQFNSYATTGTIFKTVSNSAATIQLLHDTAGITIGTSGQCVVGGSFIGTHFSTASPSVNAIRLTDAAGGIGLSGGTILGAGKITTAYTAASSTDVTNKSFCDSTYLALSGGTLTAQLNSSSSNTSAINLTNATGGIGLNGGTILGAGKITTSYTAASSTDVTNKSFCDSTYLALSGGTITGNLNLGTTNTISASAGTITGFAPTSLASGGYINIAAKTISEATASANDRSAVSILAPVFTVASGTNTAGNVATLYVETATVSGNLSSTKSYAIYAAGGSIMGTLSLTGSASTTLRFINSGGAQFNGGGIAGVATITPKAGANYDLGASGNAFNNIYSNNSVTVSDRTKKTNIANLNNQECFKFDKKRTSKLLSSQC